MVTGEEVQMLTESTERPIPYTSNRAFTELVQSRSQLDAARRSLELGLAILRGLDGEAAGPPVRALERVLSQVEEAEAALWELSQ
jgi:hypothetical protein